MDPNRIWSSEQIQVHPDLPGILKDYTKEVIRANPPDLLVFSLEFFKQRLKEKGGKSCPYLPWGYCRSHACICGHHGFVYVGAWCAAN
jgi:hypothetical protein